MTFNLSLITVLCLPANDGMVALLVVFNERFPWLISHSGLVAVELSGGVVLLQDVILCGILLLGFSWVGLRWVESPHTVLA